LTEKPRLLGVPVTYILGMVFTALFGYLLFDALFVLWFNGYTARISLFGFLVPHASKIALWSVVSLFYLRPRFGWQFFFATLLLYCLAELTTNAIFVPVHMLTDPSYRAIVYAAGMPDVFFVLSNAFFIMAIVLSKIVMRDNFYFKRDWAMLPFALLIAVWVSAGYETDSVMLYAAPGIELAEFTYSLLWLYMMVKIFFPKTPVPLE
jgi:hypothetical protein